MAKDETIKYEKEQFIRSKPESRDLLNSLLKDGEMYSVAEVEKKINTYLKRKVN